MTLDPFFEGSLRLPEEGPPFPLEAEWPRAVLSSSQAARLEEGLARVDWPASSSQADPGPLWLYVGITNLSQSLDRGTLLNALTARGLPDRTAFAGLELGPRRGVRTFGPAFLRLARLYLDPVLAQLPAHDYLPPDGLRFGVASAAAAVAVLDQLTTLLEERALAVNYARTYVISPLREGLQRAAGRVRWAYLRHRLAALRAGTCDPWVVRALAEPLNGPDFVYRRPSYARLLSTPAGQLALRRVEGDGPRARVLLYLRETGQRLTHAYPGPAWLRELQAAVLA